MMLLDRPAAAGSPPRLAVAALAATALAAAALAGCGGPARPQPEDGNVATVRSWRETVKRADRRRPRRVDLVVDYGDGSVTEQSRGPNLRPRDRPAPRPPAPSAIELDTAMAAARNHPTVQSLAQRRPIELVGGYAVHDAEVAGIGCGDGSRCLAILAFHPGDSRPAADVVVDLVSERVAVRQLEGGR